MDHFVPFKTHEPAAAAGSITRSLGWIVAAAVILALFAGVLGPGIKFGPAL
jgi:ABC-type Mn2+/Zn2+ transport system permease subunit